MKKIKIEEKDVYRSRQESVLDQESIFYESYNKAIRVLNEIISNSEIVTENDFDKNRMTNNIILFNAERGQGKTTAMRSFSDFMENPKQEEKNLLPSNIKFLSIDTIDPSCMHNRESIVRVVLTYLFSKITPRLKKVKADQANESVLKVKILEGFQKCYDFVDYLNESRKYNDFMPDDMEYISKLGNSHELKKELWSLIKNIIDLVNSDGDFKKDSETTFFVLSIDDADLSTSGTFKLCDEVRSYFSLPNVIVIMAADMNHLMDNVYEEYLSKSNLKNDRSQSRCKEMAGRYVEKLFPQGHVIRLPKMEELLLNHSTKIVLEYKDKNDKLLMENNDDGDLQDQVLEKLLRNTGILLVRPKDKLHVFLPHSMRELTHFLKMICDMEEIDYMEVLKGYVNKDFNESFQKEIEKARENLNAISQYFLDYWCSIYLEEKDVEIVNKMYSMSYVDSIYQLMNEKGPLDDFAFEGKMIAEYLCELDNNTEEKQVAYTLVYTIHNFLLLCDAWENEELMRTFLDFSCNEFDFVQYILDYMGEQKYQVLQYRITNSWFEKSLAKGISSLSYEKAFCDIFTNTEKTGENAFELLEEEKNNEKVQKIVVSQSVEYYEFDLMKSIKRLLYNVLLQPQNREKVGIKSNEVEGALKVVRLEESIPNMVGTSEENLVNELSLSLGMPIEILYTIAIYLCNIEFQKNINETICYCMQGIHDNKDLIQIYTEILRLFDASYNDFLYTKNMSTVGEEMIKIFNDEVIAQNLYSLFLSNDDNLQQIIEDYILIIKQNIESILRFIPVNHIGEITESAIDAFGKDLEEKPGIIKLFKYSNEMIYDDNFKKVDRRFNDVKDILNNIKKDCIMPIYRENLGMGSSGNEKIETIEMALMQHRGRLTSVSEELLEIQNKMKNDVVDS